MSTRIFGFGRKRPPGAAEQLRSGRRHCATCDVEHGWPFDLAAPAPDPWPHARDYEPNSALRMDGDFLSEDFCVLEGKHFLVRAILTIPVHGMAEDFGFGCWSSLSRQNFDAYVDAFDDDNPDEAAWTGWLCNSLADFVGTDPIGVWVKPRLNRQRPQLWVMADDHPLAIAQDEGITPERMLEILAFYGHAPGQ